MKIGYACLTAGIPNTKMRSCILKNATPERLCELIGHNLASLENMLRFNAENEIRLFRISSDLIPFGSSPINKLEWREIFSDKLEGLGRIIRQNGIRVSMHPGQYTVLNSPKTDVVSRAVEDLVYHEKVLSALGVDFTSKIILHLGGAYGDKKAALRRFDAAYKGLPSSIKRRLAIENDDKAYNICDVLETAVKNNIPAVYDTLHNEKNPSGSFTHSYWIKECAQTWGAEDGAQKIHYSQQAKGKAAGSHSQTIEAKDFIAFIKSIDPDPLDIMLEVKDKNISAVKCINILSNDKKALLKDWKRYKYKILELSPRHYLKANKLTDAVGTDPIEFYSVLESAFREKPDPESRTLAAKTIWHDFFAGARENEKKKFEENIRLFARGQLSYGRIKRFLSTMAGAYNVAGLKSSYYFLLDK